MAQIKAYNYYIGPWVWKDEQPEGSWCAPIGTVGLIDLRKVSDSEKTGKNPDGYGFFAVDGELSKDYFLLGNGFINSITLSKTEKDYINSCFGYLPSSSSLSEVVWELLTSNSDPNGVDSCYPLMPDSKLNLELHLGGHSLVKSEKFIYGLHPHTQKVQAVLKNEYRKCKEYFDSVGSKQYLKVLDVWKDKYEVANPEDEFIPIDLPKEKSVKHETVITESFNKGDSTTLGPDLTWTETEGDHDVVSNRARLVSSDAVASARTGSVSSNDNYAQVITYCDYGNPQQYAEALGIIMTRRETSSSVNGYGVYCDKLYGAETIALKKRVGTTTTVLDGPDSITVGASETIKVSASGSTIKGYRGGTEVLSATDTSISSGVLSGFRSYRTGNLPSVYYDSFEAGDLAGTAALTGTATASITEADIVTGGKTIILTLTGDTWVASGGTFDGQRQNIIDGIDSAQSEAHGWDVEVKAKQGVSGVVRTSDTVVTITLDAQAAYDITAQETITATIPATALTGAAQIVASPTFTVDLVSAGGTGYMTTMRGMWGT